MTTGHSNLLATPLYNLHLELGAKMVAFAGYQMPVQFPAGVKTEHLHCRSRAGLFDVSHMGQFLVSGPSSIQDLEQLMPAGLHELKINQQSYALLTNEGGGILDDLIVTRWSDDSFFLVVNAACKTQDFAHLQSGLSADTQIQELSDRALLAIQGPAAAAIMAKLCPEAENLTFMNGCPVQILGFSCYITRSGYTGEDGYEISLPAESAESIARALLHDETVQAIGLGARDSLRLEAGLCLYGHDMDRNTTPIEAGLGWSISRSRRANGARPGGFPGARQIFQQMTDGPSRKRVGLDIEGRAPVREGAEIQDLQGNPIGVVTSGGFGPSLDRPVAMAYVNQSAVQAGTEVQAIVRGKPRAARVRTLPFVQQNYVRA